MTEQEIQAWADESAKQMAQSRVDFNHKHGITWSTADEFLAIDAAIKAKPCNGCEYHWPGNKMDTCSCPKHPKSWDQDWAITPHMQRFSRFKQACGPEGKHWKMRD